MTTKDKKAKYVRCKLVQCPHCGASVDSRYIFQCPTCDNEGCDKCLFPAGNHAICIACEENE